MSLHGSDKTDDLLEGLDPLLAQTAELTERSEAAYSDFSTASRLPAVIDDARTSASSRPPLSLSLSGKPPLYAPSTTTAAAASANHHRAGFSFSFGSGGGVRPGSLYHDGLANSGAAAAGHNGSSLITSGQSVSSTAATNSAIYRSGSASRLTDNRGNLTSNNSSNGGPSHLASQYTGQSQHAATSKYHYQPFASSGASTSAVNRPPVMNSQPQSAYYQFSVQSQQHAQQASSADRSGISSVGGASAGGQTAISVETIERVRRSLHRRLSGGGGGGDGSGGDTPTSQNGLQTVDRSDGVRHAFELQLTRLKAELDDERRKRQECETQLRAKQQDAFKRDQELAVIRAACERKDKTIHQLEESAEKLNENFRRRDAEREQSSRRAAERAAALERELANANALARQAQQEAGVLAQQSERQLRDLRARAEAAEAGAARAAETGIAEVGRLREDLRRESEAKSAALAEAEAVRVERKNFETSARQRERALEAEKRGLSERQAEWTAQLAEAERTRLAEREELERVVADLKRALDQAQADLRRAGSEQERMACELADLQSAWQSREAQLEPTRRKIESEARARAERGAAERLEAARADWSRRERAARDSAQAEVRGLRDRWAKEKEALRKRFEEELDARCAEMEDRLRAAREENDELSRRCEHWKEQKRSADQQRLRMAGLVQSVMQGQCNDALTILSGGEPVSARSNATQESLPSSLPRRVPGEPDKPFESVSRGFRTYDSSSGHDRTYDPLALGHSRAYDDHPHGVSDVDVDAANNDSPRMTYSNDLLGSEQQQRVENGSQNYDPALTRANDSLLTQATKFDTAISRASFVANHGLAAPGHGSPAHIASSHAYDPPMTQTSKYDSSMTQASKYDPPMTQASKYDSSMTQASKYDSSMTQASKYDPSMTQASKYDPPMTQASKYDPPMTQASKYDSSMTQTSKYDSPMTQASKYDSSMTQASKYDPSTTQASKYDPSMTQTSKYNPSMTLAGYQLNKPSASSGYESPYTRLDRSHAAQPSLRDAQMTRSSNQAYDHSMTRLYDSSSSMTQAGNELQALSTSSKSVPPSNLGLGLDLGHLADENLDDLDDDGFSYLPSSQQQQQQQQQAESVAAHQRLPQLDPILEADTPRTDTTRSVKQPVGVEIPSSPSGAAAPPFRQLMRSVAEALNDGADGEIGFDVSTDEAGNHSDRSF